jgi:hypothetical protein
MPDDWLPPFRELLKGVETLFEKLIETQKELAIKTAQELANMQEKVGHEQAELYQGLITAQREITVVLTKLSDRLDDLELRLATPPHQDPIERPES